MQQQVDRPFSVRFTSTPTFNAQFWFRTSQQSAPRLDQLLGLLSAADVAKGFQLLLNFSQSSPVPSSRLTTKVIHHGPPLPLDLSGWALMILRLTFDANSAAALSVKIDVFLNSLFVPVVSASVAFENGQMNDEFYLSIGSSSAFDAFCRR